MIPSQRRDLAWGIVDLDLLSQIPQKDARIIGRERERESFFKVNNGGERESQELRRKASTHEGEEEPLLKGSQICPLWAFATMAGTSCGRPEVPVAQSQRSKTAKRETE